MTWWATTILAIGVAFVTSLLSEELKIWLYRDKHVRERRFLLQVDWLPKYVEALNWAAGACDLVNSGWQLEGADPFHYATEAAVKMAEAINTGITTSYFFDGKTVRPTILEFGDRMLKASNAYQIDRDAVRPRPTELTQSMRDVFEKIAREIRAQEATMKTRMDELLGLSK